MIIKTAEQLEAFREGGKILAQIIRELAEAVKPGITTRSLDVLARARIEHYKVKPSFLGYNNFPAVVCLSVNEEAVHGIPSDRVIKEGDLLKIDFGVVHKGLHTDSAITVLVTEKTPKQSPEYAEKRRLISVTRDALAAGIKQAKPGKTIADIGEAIKNVVETAGLAIVKELGGHGIGTKLHEEPFIPNYPDGSFRTKLVDGMVIALEPIVSMGDWQIDDGADGSVYVMRDKSLAAHFEHTIIITEKGPLVVTK